MDSNVPIRDAFKIADDVLRQGVKGISEIITVRDILGDGHGPCWGDAACRQPVWACPTQRPKLHCLMHVLLQRLVEVRSEHCQSPKRTPLSLHCLWYHSTSPLITLPARWHVALLRRLQVPGLVNVDFADVSAIMSGAGSSLMGQGYGCEWGMR